MASNRPLPQDLTASGQDQTSLSRWQNNITDLINELQTDAGTQKTTIDQLRVLTTELRADHATFLTLTNELKADMDFVRNSMKDVLIKLDSDPGASNTNYAALHGPGGSATSLLPAADVAAANVATITATNAAAGPAALTNSTAITLLRS